jgi:23S rRNA pseudouridine1911/1915/1917 synthase
MGEERPVDEDGVSAAGSDAGRPAPLVILFEDAHLLVVAKPPGLSTQAPPIAGATLETAVRAYLHPDGPADAFVGTVHRLDRPVSGVVLWAKHPKAARRLSQQFERRQVRKEYWALVEGGPPPEPGASGEWEDWLCREDTGVGRVQACAPGTPRAQRALTRWRAERVGGGGLGAGLALLRLEPETGRMHQLRVQAAARGWPVVGDALYGSTATFPEGIALHARRLVVRHPVLERPLTFVAPLPPAWPPAPRGLAARERLPDE